MVDQETVSLAEASVEIIAHNYLHVLAIAILYYDHIITFGDEFHYLWLRPKGLSAYWFFLNRYFAFLGNLVVTVMGFTTLSDSVCKSYNLFRQLLLVFNQVLVCVLLTLRIYALFGRSLRVLGMLVGSGVVLIIIACWSLFGQKHLPPSPQTSGCHIGLSRETSIRIASAWEALMVYDSMIFCFTLFRTWTTRRDHNITGINIPLISLILRDGSIYYGVMALANLSNILTFYLCGPYLRGGLSTFASSISVTMMSRIMLNLHQSADVGIYSTNTTSTMQYTDSTYSGCGQSTSVELDTLWSDMFDRSPQNSPVRSTFPARRDDLLSPVGYRRQSRIRWQDTDAEAQVLERST